MTPRPPSLLGVPSFQKPAPIAACPGEAARADQAQGRSSDIGEEKCDRRKGDRAMKTQATTHYAVGAKVWYRDSLQDTTFLRGVVDDITFTAPTVVYFVRLETKDCVWAAFPQLLPR
jgi:hypothetical protein